MAADSAFRQALEKADFRQLQRLHTLLFPHLPAPRTDEEAEISLHMARTLSDWLDDDKRCYSHAWLKERDYPSQLPDELKPKADRLYPTVHDAVFVSANSNSPFVKPIAKIAQGAMCDAVEDCYANGDKEPKLVRSRMMEAKARTFRQLLGVKL